MRDFLRSLFRGVAPAAGSPVRTFEAPDEPTYEPITSTPVYLSPAEVVALLADKRFWMGWLNVAFMPQASELDHDLIASTVGLTDEEAFEFWNVLSGHYEGVLDESDGYIERPKTLAVPFEAGRQMEIQFHPGAVIYEMRDGGGTVEALAELSGHWTLPGISWSEAATLASAAERNGSIPHAAAVLLIAPLAHPYRTADIPAAEAAIRRAFEELAVADADDAAALSAAWREDAMATSRLD